jgi:peptidoglycan/xylan/chitin deacetylase (PgdA/CDA1 family)
MLRALLGTARNVALRAATSAGVNRAVRDSAWRRRRLLILCYHGVSLHDEHEWSDLYVTADHLVSRLRLIKAAGYDILPFGDAVRRLYEGTLPPRSVVVTFDDGFADFYLKAYPILLDLAVRSVVYLTTYHVANRLPVFNPLLSYLLWKGRGHSLKLPDVFGATIEIPRNWVQRDKVHLRIVDHAERSGWSATEKDQVASQVSAQLGIDLDALRAKRCFQLMSREELTALDRDLVDIQLHTHRHRNPRDEKLFTREIIDNRRAIEDWLPGRSDLLHFCYPGGNYDAMLLPWLRAQGVVSATTCDPGIASARHDPLLLPRLIDTPRVPEPVFQSWLAGTADWLVRRRC